MYECGREGVGVVGEGIGGNGVQVWDGVGVRGEGVVVS